VRELLELTTFSLVLKFEHFTFVVFVVMSIKMLIKDQGTNIH